MTIGDRIKQRRLELDLSVDDLAGRLGKNRATVYRYESNDIEYLPITLMSTLAKALNTTPAFLMGWECDEPSQNKITDLSNQTIRLINDNIEKLNNNGQKKLLDYSEILVGNPDYVEDSTPILNAAHARTDIKQTPEGKAHDDAIMMDPKEWE